MAVLTTDRYADTLAGRCEADTITGGGGADLLAGGGDMTLVGVQLSALTGAWLFVG
jgi:hypothetical protein